MNTVQRYHPNRWSPGKCAHKAQLASCDEQELLSSLPLNHPAIGAVEDDDGWWFRIGEMKVYQPFTVMRKLKDTFVDNLSRIYEITSLSSLIAVAVDILNIYHFSRWFISLILGFAWFFLFPGKLNLQTGRPLRWWGSINKSIINRPEKLGIIAQIGSKLHSHLHIIKVFDLSTVITHATGRQVGISDESRFASANIASRRVGAQSVRSTNVQRTFVDI